MRHTSMIAWAVAAAILGGVGPASACPLPRFRWVAPPELPPGATIYAVPAGPFVFVTDELTSPCDSGFFPRARWEGEGEGFARQWRGAGDEVAVREGDRALPRDVDVRLVGFDAVLAVTVGSPSGPFTLDGGSDVDRRGTWSRKGEHTARTYRIGARSPAWTVAAAATERDDGDPLLVDRRPCTELRLRGAGVGYWVLETQGCLDRLVVPDEYGVVETSLYVPPRCRGDRGSVTVVAHYFDGSSSRHRVRTDDERDGSTGLRFGAAGALVALVLVRLRRRRPRGAMVPR